MSFFEYLFKKKPKQVIDFTDIRSRFELFLKILEQNNNALKTISELEEKSGGDYLFDMEFIKSSLDQLDKEVKEIVDLLNTMSRNRYPGLTDTYSSIHAEIHNSLPGEGKIIKDIAVIPFEKLDLGMARQVGSKCANLGELKNRVGLPIPNGFSISAYGYKLFIENNRLHDTIQQKIQAIDIKNYELLERISGEIQEIIKTSELPGELKNKIAVALEQLHKDNGKSLFSVRSSALGEDTQFSFAGQYASYLNVHKEQIIACYLDVMASQFTPRAMYYYLCQGLKHDELAMSVACMKMVNAVAAGVIYTVNPIDPKQQVIIINSVWGLGKLVVDGTITPDSFIIDKNENTIVAETIAEKLIQLKFAAGGGVSIVEVEDEKKNLPSLTSEQIIKLAEFAKRIEDHYDEPQDIEWAIAKNGDIFFLQSRPLRVYQKEKIKKKINLTDVDVLFSGGITAASGVGGGKVFHLKDESELKSCPDGAVIVAHNSFPSLVMIMNRVNAIITEVGGITGHMATVAREFRIPTLMNVTDVFSLIPNNIEITLDTDNCTIYKGFISELISERAQDQNIFEDTALFVTLERILKKIVPLHMVSPRSLDFIPANCRTYHDIIRFAHQKALYEMFQVVEISKSDMAAAPSLKTKIPLPIKILFIDSEHSHLNLEEEIPDDNIPSEPMRAFWSGIQQVGWPHPPSLDVKGFASVLATSINSGAAARNSFGENSFALLSKEYMNFSIRMGYHYSTIEALCTESPHKNYVRIKFQDGGASLDRRRRRVQLIVEILKEIGFDNFNKGDFLDCGISHCEREVVLEKLEWLGALSVHTKQLDMVLSTDDIALWYKDEILTKLKAM